MQEDITQGLLLLYLPPLAIALGAGITLVTGLLAGLLPALRPAVDVVAGGLAGLNATTVGPFWTMLGTRK